MSLILTILAIILVVLIVNYETIKFNYRAFLMFARGVIAPNKFWANASETLLTDASGVQFYTELKKKYGNFAPKNFFGRQIYLVMHVPYMKEMLDKSPDIFGVGTVKYDVFKSFMSKNVGVSHGCPWKNRRILNERVLSTDKIPRYAEIYHKYIYDIFKSQSKLPTNFNDFNKIGQEITFKIVFNQNTVIPEVFEIFPEANDFSAIWYGEATINPRVKDTYTEYLNSQIDNPQQFSLVNLAVDSIKTIKPCHNENEKEEIFHQIPHWLFPIVSTFHTNLPRFMTILINHPKDYTRVINELNSLKENLNTASSFYELPYLRKCILESLRLNNPVTTTFRTLLQDYKFSETEYFPKFSEFLILNAPVLRDPAFFKEPNKFIPDRWTPEAENSYYAIMFNQGAQRCPAKELAIFLIMSGFINLLEVADTTQIQVKKIDTDYVPQILNPFSLKFKYKK